MKAMKLIYKIVFIAVGLCISNSSLAQEYSDNEIGLDVERLTKKLKSRNISDESIQQEISIMRDQHLEMYKNKLIFEKKNVNEQNSKTQNIENVVQKVSQSERDALIALYNATNGPLWTGGSLTFSNSWKINDINSDISKWYGVTVDNGKVTGLLLGLYFDSFKGFIPDLSALTELSSLIISDPIISGGLSGLQNLKKLKTIRITRYGTILNNLESIVPLCGLINLEEISLVGCTFNSNSLPTQLNQLTNLKELFIRSESLSENLSILGSLPSLTTIRLECNFSNGLPSNFTSLQNLIFIDMNFNLINDISVLQYIPALQYINFEYNNLTTIPDGFTNLNNIKVLKIRSNEISGKLTFLSNNLQLKELDIGDNKFEGSIPDLIFSDLTVFFPNNVGFYFDETSKFLRFDQNKFRFVDFANRHLYYKSTILQNHYVYKNQAYTDTEYTENKTTGSSVTFSMSADGSNRYTPDDTFQWFKGIPYYPGSVAINSGFSASNRQLTISNVTAADAGDYYCLSKHPQITNPIDNSQDLVLERNPIHLKVSSCPPINGSLSTEGVSINSAAIVPYVCGNNLRLITFTPTVPQDGLTFQWIVKSPTNEVLYTSTSSYGTEYEFTIPGINTVELVVKDANGCTSLPFTTTVEVITCPCPPLEGSLSTQVTSINSGEILPYVCGNSPRYIYFNPTIPSDRYTFQWTIKSPTNTILHTSAISYGINYEFTIPGINTVELVVTEPNNCSTTFTTTVEVITCPCPPLVGTLLNIDRNNPDLEVPEPYVCGDNSRRFRFSYIETSMTYKWNIKSPTGTILYTTTGNPSGSQLFLDYVFTIAGINTVELVVTESNNCSTAFTTTVEVITCPCKTAGGYIVNARGDEEYTCGDSLRNIYFSFSEEPNLNYQWTITSPTGNVLYTTTNPNFNYTFSLPGKNTITLVVTEPNGCISTFTESLTVVACSCPPLKAEFRNFDRNNPDLEIPEPYVCGDNSRRFRTAYNQDLIVSYLWTIKSPTGNILYTTTGNSNINFLFLDYVFTIPGINTVELVITESNNCSTTFTTTVEVATCPCKILGGQIVNYPSEGVEEYICGDSLQFIDFFYYGEFGLNYQWTITSPTGNVLFTTTSSQLFSYTFTIPGINTITLVVTEPNGCSSTFTESFTVVACSNNCEAEVNFNFNFKLPSSVKGGILTNPNRENIANGLINFLNSNITQELYLTTYDDFSSGVRFVANQTKYTTTFPVATTNTSNETQGGFFRFQDDFYNDTFKNIITNGTNAILNNTALTKKFDVSFFVISEDRFADMNQVITAYNQFLASNKTSKIFFVLLNEGKFTNYSTNTPMTPLEFVTQVKGSSPVNFTSTNSILDSDYITYTKAEIENSSFQNVFSVFLQNAFNEVKSSKCTTPSCTVKNPSTASIKQKLIKLVTHLRSLTTAPTNGYICPELLVLKPYLSDVNPGIYDLSNTPTSISFSFSNHGTSDKDVVLNYSSTNKLLDFDLSKYEKASTATPIMLSLQTAESNMAQPNTVRHINFCPTDICIHHVAVVIDESGSLNFQDITKIKRQLKSFIAKEQKFNEEEAGNLYVSFIGMSDSDQDKRKDHILFEKITAATAPAFNAWLDGPNLDGKVGSYGNRYGNSALYPGISAGSDFWKSGLELALRTSPELVIMITDGAQTNDPEGLKGIMKDFNNYNHPLEPYKLATDKPHLYVIGTDDGFYIDGDLAANRVFAKGQDPNSPTKSIDLSTYRIDKSATGGTLTSSLKKSLKYLLNLQNSIFPTVTNPFNFNPDDYSGFADFKFIGDEVNQTFISTNVSRFLASSGYNNCGPTGTNSRCETCFSFQPKPSTPDNEKFYILNAWAKEELNIQVTQYKEAKIMIVFKDENTDIIPNTTITASPSGDIIDGWQRIWKKFEVPASTNFIEFKLVNESSNVPVFFDDIRIYPVKGNMKSFVYDPETFRLMAELDENNYATYYEYDNEGGLVRIKKETAKGIKTIQETRSGNVIKENK